MEERTIRRIAIVGGGVTGWMSAAYLSHMLGDSVTITVIDLRDHNETAFDLGSIPPLKAFHQTLGINELDLIAKTQGSIKLGTQLINFGHLGNRYFHPHGFYGAEFDAVPLHQWWLKARTMGQPISSLDHLSMARALAIESRFSHPVADRRLIQSTFDYAYHMDGALYANYLAVIAQKSGVQIVSGNIHQIVRNTTTGFVEALALSTSTIIEADLYLDCSGPTGILIHQELESGFVSSASVLPCDRIVGVDCARGSDFSPYTRATAQSAGWQSRIPLQHRTRHAYIYASDYTSDEAAANNLMDNLDGRSLSAPKQTSFINGRSRQPFVKNVLALGGAAGFLEPLEATALHFVQSGLTRLLALWPTRDCDVLISHKYNDLTNTEWDLARDFIALQYFATSRTDVPFWSDCKNMSVSDSLQDRIAHWSAYGRLISPQPELFQSASWLSVFVGQGVMPKAHDPLADARAGTVDFEARLSGLERIILETAAQMPTHADWINKHARATKT